MYVDISSSENINDFVKESILMLGFQHPNVLKLLGVCFDTEDGLPLIVLPYMANGDLKSFLMSKRGQTSTINLAHFPAVTVVVSSRICRPYNCVDMYQHSCGRKMCM